MGKVISFINYKGGVGKTTTTYHIGCALSLYHNKKVLLVDVDPQTNLTFLCVVPERWEVFKSEDGTTASLFEHYLQDSFEKFPSESIIWKSPIELFSGSKITKHVVRDLDLIPSDIDLLGIDIDLAAKVWRKIESGFMQEPIFVLKRTLKRVKEALGLDTSSEIRDALFYVDQRRILRDFINRVKDYYDYVLIDCPPNLYLVTQNALAASDYYLITSIPDHMSTIGINILMEKIRELNATMQRKCDLAGSEIHNITLKGILFTMVRTFGQGVVNTHKDKMNELRRDHSDLCFENYISWGAGYTEAAAQAVPVFLLKDDNSKRVAGQYKLVTEEFLDKVGG
ncbi:ATPases [Candidatus Scalindua japonica]|uniref:ATPases n=1 Tax=Candidatus Scalindua japonica TaxID=1284222 RepID=A0A286U086_9BACT|nr:AAA family ATPase [Candidatus Scalindua japonica]GAX61550.1 ATPases [Candidatus Scalindua japonica]